MRTLRLILACLLSLPTAAIPAFAHDFKITDTQVLLCADGGYRVDLTLDLDALALGEPVAGNNSAELAARLRALPPAELDGKLAGLRELLAKRLRIRFDGQVVDPEVTFPEYQAAGSEHSENPSVLGVTARLSGRAPAGAREFTFWASRAFQAVHLTIHREGRPEVVRHILAVADESPPYPLGNAAPGMSWPRVAWEYALLGYEHILPRGFDHILFVVGLFLLSRHLRPLLWQITAFTVAHSITLALSVYGVFRLPSSIVEPLIALSIAYVAIENIFTSRLHPWRPAIVFGFGLLHGMGFAGVLQELGLPQGQFATALAMFNVGVELGQLSVIALAFLAVGWLREARRYRTTVVIPASCGIAAFALYLTVVRIAG